MVSHVFAFCLKVSTSVKVNFRTAGIFLGYLVATSNKHFQAIIHMIQNCHSGKQKTRWEKTNKGNYHSVSLGPGSASGGKRRKKLAWAKTKIGEQSEPRGSLLRGKGWRRLRHPFPLPRQPLGSLRSPIFFLFNPVFCLPPPPPADPGPTLPFSQRMYAFAFQHIGFVPRDCAKGLFSFLI